MNDYQCPNCDTVNPPVIDSPLTGEQCCAVCWYADPALNLHRDYGTSYPYGQGSARLLSVLRQTFEKKERS